MQTSTTFYFLVTASLPVPPISFGKLLLSYSSHSILVFLPMFTHVWLHTERYICIENHFHRNNKMVAVRGWGQGGIGWRAMLVKGCMCVLVTHSCPTLCHPMDCNPPDSSIHGILWARIPEWAAISFSRGSSCPRGCIWVSCFAGRFFTLWGTRKALIKV